MESLRGVLLAVSFSSFFSLVVKFTASSADSLHGRARTHLMLISCGKSNEKGLVLYEPKGQRETPAREKKGKCACMLYFSHPYVMCRKRAAAVKDAELCNSYPKKY